MPDKVELYDGEYGNYDADVYRQVRLETYGVDFGQTSWVTNEESRAIPQALQLTPASRVLEIGCGSGGYALQVAAVAGCSIVGVDINDAGVRNANTLARGRHLADRVSFEQRDVEFPVSWSQNATNIVAQKYFRGQLGSPMREHSVKQMIGRVAGTIAGWGAPPNGGALAITRFTPAALAVTTLMCALATIG